MCPVPPPARPGVAPAGSRVTAAARRVLVVLPAFVVLAACGSGQSSPARQVQSWASSTGFAATLRQLRGDLQRVPMVSAAAAGQRRTVCDVLVTDALAANEQLPSPDDALTALLAHAYSAAASSGHACFAGPSPAAADDDAQSALRLLVQAEARYDAVTSSLVASIPARSAPASSVQALS